MRHAREAALTRTHERRYPHHFNALPLPPVCSVMIFKKLGDELLEEYLEVIHYLGELGMRRSVLVRGRGAGAPSLGDERGWNCVPVLGRREV